MCQAAAAAAADLPELHPSASPVPPPDAADPAATAAGANQQHTGVKAFGAGGAGMYSTLLSPVNNGSTASWPGGSGHPLNGCNQPQQPVSLSTGESAAKFGAAAAAASEALASSVPSFYNGAGPLTAGARRDWTGVSKSGSGVQAGKDLAQVLRSGYSPGNKSLAEIQADYRAARGLLMDQLKRQKEAAEQQRKQILLQIGRAINSNKWH